MGKMASLFVYMFGYQISKHLIFADAFFFALFG